MYKLDQFPATWVDRQIKGFESGCSKEIFAFRTKNDWANPFLSQYGNSRLSDAKYFCAAISKAEITLSNRLNVQLFK